METPTVYEHPSSSAAIQRLLRTKLPESITLLRRIQHHYHPASAHIFATFSPEEAESLSAFPEAYAIVFFDRTSWSGVSAWLFWSGELDAAKDAHKAALSQEIKLQAPKDDADRHLITVLGHLHSVGSSQREPEFTAQYGSDPVRVGCIHGRACYTLASLGLVPKPSPPAVYKYLFTKSGVAKTGNGTSISKASSLPVGLVWDTIQALDADRVMETNPYMRNKNHLEIITGVGVRVTADYTSTAPAPSEGSPTSDAPGTMIAWGFLGLEGSVRTLHVEERFRRLGLARKIVFRLVTQHLDEYGPEDLCDAEIFPGNDASVALFESLGAKYANDVYWVPVDLAATAQSLSL